MESIMQELLTILTSSSAQIESTTYLQTMLQELRSSQDIHARGMAGIDPSGFQSQERPELQAVREALLSGDKLKAIKLYRSIYGVSLKEAQDALDVL